MLIELRLSVTSPLYPPIGLTWIVYVAVWPAVTFWKLSVPAVSELLKSPAEEFTISVTVELCVSDPLVPVTVTL
jgi:hypothetical protein